VQDHVQAVSNSCGGHEGSSLIVQLCSGCYSCLYVKPIVLVYHLTLLNCPFCNY
jgi:hypothetical protein